LLILASLIGAGTMIGNIDSRAVTTNRIIGENILKLVGCRLKTFYARTRKVISHGWYLKKSD